MTNKFIELLQEQQDLHPDLVPYIENVDRIGPCLRHPLIYSLFYTPVMNAVLNQQYASKLEFLAKALEEKKFSQFIWLHERPYRLNKFCEIQDSLSDSDYWKILGEIWSDSENLWQFGQFLEILLNSDRTNRSEMMNDEEAKFFDLLPDEFTIYRGHHGHNKNGYSWTLSYWTAKWFSIRFSQSQQGVLKANVKKEQVVAALLGRNEFEIVTMPKNLNNIVSIKHVKRPKWLDELHKEFCRTYMLKKHSYHGPWHWEKVEYNALQLAKHTKQADTKVVRVFALIHDTKRANEDYDPEHGHRSADYAQFLWKQEKLDLTKKQLDVLMEACRYHNDGQITEDPTIGVCWDADRLDLTRVGIIPDPKYLSTAIAKELLWKI